MGRILDRFKNLDCSNEAEVSQKFVLPLLHELLGYDLDAEILPEKVIPAFEVPLNREKRASAKDLKAKPDYVLKLPMLGYVGICDSKAPRESLDEHEDQMVAYCLALRGPSLLLITNSKSVRVSFAWTRLFETNGLEDLDLRFDELLLLLGRESVVRKTEIERIAAHQQIVAERLSATRHASRRQVEIAVALSTFRPYLGELALRLQGLALPTAIEDAFHAEVRSLRTEALHTFHAVTSEGKRDSIAFDAVLPAEDGGATLLVGESGIGKSSILRQLAREQARRCLALKSEVVPVLARLGDLGPGMGLATLVRQAMASAGYDLTDDELFTQLRAGRLLLLLDALDEAPSSVSPEVERSISAWLRDFPKMRVILTTRPSRVPRIATFRRCEVDSLAPDRVTTFLGEQLGPDAGQFLNELHTRRLSALTTNTLLLTLLALLFRRHKSLPASRTRVLEAVIDTVRSVEIEKADRGGRLDWDSCVRILSGLAARTVTAGDGYALPNSVALDFVRGELARFERLRATSAGISVSDALDSLSATGFLSVQGDSLVFWHRALAEHFAAVDLADRLDTGEVQLLDLINRVQWELVLPMALARANWRADLIPLALEHNVFIGAVAAIETGTANEPLMSIVVGALESRLVSPTHAIRAMAGSLLVRLHGEVADQALARMMESPYVELQMRALPECVRRKLPGYDTNLDARLEWPVRPPHWKDGFPTVPVIEGLAELNDEKSQHKIVALWKRHRDVYTDSKAADTLTQLARRGCLEPSVREALLEWLVTPSDEPFVHFSGVAKVLAATANPSLVGPLTKALERGDGTGLREHDFRFVLASFKDADIVQQVAQKALDRNLDTSARLRFAQVLSESVGSIPLDVALSLAQDPDARLRANGFKLLSAFPFESYQPLLKDELRLFARAPQEQGPGLAWLQRVLFELLDRHRQLQLVTTPEFAPEVLFDLSLEVLIRSIARDNAGRIVDLVRDVIHRVNYGLRAEFTIALAESGQIHEARNFRDEVLRSGESGAINILLKGIAHLEPAEASTWLTELQRGTQNIPRERRWFGDPFIAETCFFALQSIHRREGVYWFNGEEKRAYPSRNWNVRRGFLIHSEHIGRVGGVLVTTRDKPATVYVYARGYVGPAFIKRELSQSRIFGEQHQAGWTYVVDTTRLVFANLLNLMSSRNIRALPNLWRYGIIAPSLLLRGVIKLCAWLLRPDVVVKNERFLPPEYR